MHGSMEPWKRSVCLAPQIQTALRHKSEIEHHRNKIRLRAKRRGHYEFPVLDELSSGDTRERHRVYRRAQMQIDKILDPTASVPSVFIEPRKRWACGRGGGRPRLAVACGDSGLPAGGDPSWRSPVGRLLPPQLPRDSPFPGFLSPGIQLSETGAPSLSDAEPWLPLPSVLVLPSPPVSSPPSACWMLTSFPAAALSLLFSWFPRPLLLKGEAFSVRPALICVLLCPPLYWIRLPVGGPCAPVPGGAPSLHPAAPHRWACRPTRRWPHCPLDIHVHSRFWPWARSQLHLTLSPPPSLFIIFVG